MLKFQTLTFNVETAQVRNAKLEGRDYIVAPMVMLTEGVHEGSNGPLYYPKEELEKFPGVWDHKPIVVYHPEKDGEPVSACDLAILNSRKVGLILNTKFDGKLRNEAWFEKSKIGSVDKRVEVALLKKKKMEVSTGLYLEVDPVAGEWNGEKYTGIARNFKPDHLALLPDKVGACSLEDGAGLFQLNSVSTSLLLNHPKSLEGGLLSTVLEHGALKQIQNELSFSSIQSALRSVLRDSLGDAWDGWLEDVFDSYFIYWDNQKLMKQKYLATDTEVTLVDKPVQVIRVVDYLPVGVPVKNESKEDQEMEKKKIVDALIANTSNKWEEKDREFLMGLSDEQVSKFESMVPPPETKPVVKNQDPEEEEGDEEEKPITNQQKPITLDDYINSAPAEMRGVLRRGVIANQQHKSSLIQTILGNAKNKFTQERLNQMEIEDLEPLAALAQAEQPATQNSSPMYLGAATPAPTQNSAVQQPLGLPTMNEFFEKKKAS